MPCINIKHPEYLALQETLDIHPDLLKAEVSLWMKKNTEERFPTAKELGYSVKENPNVLYQRQKLDYHQQQANQIYWDWVYGEDLSTSDIRAINNELVKLSNAVGDTPWFVRQSANTGNYYIAGYKNRPVTSKDYYSPYANGVYRQTTSNIEEAPIEELTKKLYDWASTHGIAIEAMSTLIERFEGRYEQGVLGVADFANALIGIADDARLDTLPEEIAHFAVELLAENPAVIRALETVHLTPEYSLVQEEYKDIYTTEEQFRKETLGKLLAAELINQFTDATITKEPSITKEEQTFWTYLRSLKNQFVSWVKSNFNKNSQARTDLKNSLVPIAKSILNNEYLGESIPTTAPTLYQTKEQEQEPEEVENPVISSKKKFLEEVHLQLASRMKQLKNNAKNTTVTDALERELEKIEYNIAKGELDLGISNFIKLAESEIDVIHKALINARTKGVGNPTTLVNANSFMQMYSDVFANFLENMYEFGIPLEETEELRKMIHNLAIKIQESKGINNVLIKRAAKNSLLEANTDANGNKIDPDFDENQVVEDTFEDVSTWRLQVGNYKYSDSKVIKAAHKIIFDSINKIKRFTTRTANTLLSAQEVMLKNGGKIQDIIETDANGNSTHFFIREYHWDKYYQAMNETKASIAKQLGYESYGDIKKVFLKPEELVVLRASWAQFFKQHSSKQTIVSDGGVKIDITVPNSSYRNHKFDEVMQNPHTKAYYDLLIKTKKEALAKLPLQYRTEKLAYMVPPILKSTLDRLGTIRGGKSFMGAMGALASEALFIDKDDTQFGQLNVLNNKLVPIHFVHELDNVKDISYDVARSITLFAEMAENFQDMNKIAGDLGTLQLTLAERNYYSDKKKNIRKKGIESNEYEALENLMDTHVFGIQRKALETKPVPSNQLTEKLGIAGKQFSWTKASQRLATFIRNNNLGFNFTTAISGYLKGSGDSIIEDQIGIYTTNESKNWARLEFFTNLHEVVGQIGKPKQTNKMHLILQEAGVVELEKMLKDSTKNRAIRRGLTSDLLYTTFATGDYGVKGRIALAVYDNYRLHNGEFLTRASFFKKRIRENGATSKEFQKQIEQEWSDSRKDSLYNAYEVVNGQLTVKQEYQKYVTEAVLNSVAGKVENVTTYVDGTLSATDKGKLSRSIAGDFLLMHRGWFIGMMDTRLRKEGTNLITEEDEIGTYRATGDFLYNQFFKTLIKERGNLSAAFATYNTLTPARKRGLAKTALDLLYLNIIAFVAACANLAADDADDEDWTLQYTAYQLNRLLLEQGAAWNPSELINMIDEPVVGARFIKDLLDISEAFNTKVYERGMYAGQTHAEKWWKRKTPFKNIYEMQFPDMKNNFIKKMVDSNTYRWMSPEQAHSVTEHSFFKDLLSGDDGNVEEVVPVIIEDLEEDTTEENGFN